MKKGKIKYLMGVFFIILICFLPYNYFRQNRVYDAEESMIGIDDLSFFDHLLGEFIIYFGSPTCPECVVFETYLLSALEETETKVYYFNTSYWKGNERFDEILEKYRVDAVPLLVYINEVGFVETFNFQSGISDDESREDLRNFLSRAEKYPSWIGNKLQGVILLFLSWQMIYLWRKRKELIAYGKREFFFLQIGLAALLLLFSYKVYEYGIYYSGFCPIQEEAWILTGFREPFLLYSVVGMLIGQISLVFWIIWKQYQKRMRGEEV